MNCVTRRYLVHLVRAGFDASLHIVPELGELFREHLAIEFLAERRPEVGELLFGGPLEDFFGAGIDVAFEFFEVDRVVLEVLVDFFEERLDLFLDQRGLVPGLVAGLAVCLFVQRDGQQLHVFGVGLGSDDVFDLVQDVGVCFLVDHFDDLLEVRDACLGLEQLLELFLADLLRKLRLQLLVLHFVLQGFAQGLSVRLAVEPFAQGRKVQLGRRAARKRLELSSGAV